jgi:carboxypeptidase Q
MVGGHLDSWISGTGATENGAASVVPTRTALLIGEGIRDVLPHSLGYWNDGAQKSAGNGNGCG